MKDGAALEGFNTVQETTDFGVHSVHLENGAGVTVRLSQFGIEKLGESAFTEVVEAAISQASSDTYPPAPRPDWQFYKADQSRDVYRKHKTGGAVYGSGEYIIKSGMDSSELRPAEVQYGVMNWLHTSLDAIDDPVDAPQQYALISSPSGLPVTVMQKVSGTPLQELGHPLAGLVPPEQSKKIYHLGVQAVRTAAQKALGTPASKLFVNDIGQRDNLSNIIVRGQPGEQDASYSVIDQPSFILLRDRLRLVSAYEALRRLYS